MESTIPLIIEERTDRRRQNVSQQGLKANPTVIISVEGWNDMLWLKDIISTRRGDAHVTIKFERDEGKIQVINRVRRCESDYGIVDMDHDFHGESISSDSLCDTRGLCCTFGAIIENFSGSDLRQLILASVAQRHRDQVRRWLINPSGKQDQLLIIARKTTKLRLFFAWASKPGLSWKKSNNGEPPSSQLYKKIEDRNFRLDFNLADYIKNCHGIDTMDLWLKFEGRFSNKLQSCGINDHEMQNCMESWLTRYNFEYSESGFKRKIKKIRLKMNEAPIELIKYLKHWDVLSK